MIAEVGAEAIRRRRGRDHFPGNQIECVIRWIQLNLVAGPAQVFVATAVAHVAMPTVSDVKLVGRPGYGDEPPRHQIRSIVLGHEQRIVVRKPAQMSVAAAIGGTLPFITKVKLVRRAGHRDKAPRNEVLRIVFGIKLHVAIRSPTQVLIAAAMRRASIFITKIHHAIRQIRDGKSLFGRSDLLAIVGIIQCIDIFDSGGIDISRTAEGHERRHERESERGDEAGTNRSH